MEKSNGGKFYVMAERYLILWCNSVDIDYFSEVLQYDSLAESIEYMRKTYKDCCDEMIDLIDDEDAKLKDLEDSIIAFAIVHVPDGCKRIPQIDHDEDNAPLFHCFEGSTMLFEGHYVMINNVDEFENDIARVFE